MKILIKTYNIMRIIIKSILLLFGFSPSFGQSIKISNNQIGVITKIKDSYNMSNYQDIYYLYTQDMKEYFSISETINFFEKLKIDAAEIIRTEYIKENNGVVWIKTEFKHGTYWMKVAFDNKDSINGLQIEPIFSNVNTMRLENKTNMKLPFHEEWTVIWGGETKELNYHVESQLQKGAIDFILMNDSQKTHINKGDSLLDYFSFGKSIYSPCDGEIILAVDGINDNIIGKNNSMYPAGNSIMIKTPFNEIVFLAHLKQNSLKVIKGQFVKQGELLGLCGNSGNSSEPHLHIHIQDSEDWDLASGVVCKFQNLLVNGIIKAEYSPQKNDRVKSIN